MADLSRIVSLLHVKREELLQQLAAVDQAIALLRSAPAGDMVEEMIEDHQPAEASSTTSPPLVPTRVKPKRCLARSINRRSRWAGERHDNPRTRLPGTRGKCPTPLSCRRSRREAWSGCRASSKRRGTDPDEGAAGIEPPLELVPRGAPKGASAGVPSPDLTGARPTLHDGFVRRLHRHRPRPVFRLVASPARGWKSASRTLDGDERSERAHSRADASARCRASHGCRHRPGPCRVGRRPKRLPPRSGRSRPLTTRSRRRFCRPGFVCTSLPRFATFLS